MPVATIGSPQTIALAANEALIVSCGDSSAVASVAGSTGFVGAPYELGRVVGEQGRQFGPYGRAVSLIVSALSGSVTADRDTPSLPGRSELPPAALPVAALEVRGDSFVTGVGLTDVAAAFGQLLANTFNSGVFSNFGVSSTGVYRQFQRMIANSGPAIRPVQSTGALTFWLAGYNDMRSGATAGRLAAHRGILMAGLLLMAGRWAGFRQFYNGGTGGTFFGGPASTFTVTGTWGISAQGVTNEWRAITNSTNGSTITATVNGSTVYVIFDRNKVNTGGTFSVAVDGVTVLPSVSCDGTGLAVENANDEPACAAAVGGYPTVLRIPCAPGRHTVLLTVTSATGASNFVQVWAIAGNGDLLPDRRSVVVGLCPRMNAAGYAGSVAAYASQAVGDAAVVQYQAVQRDVVTQLAADGFDVRVADISAYYDPLRAGELQADNIHPTAQGQANIATAMTVAEQPPLAGPAPAYSGGSAVQTLTAPASGTAWQNTLSCVVDVFVTGGTVTAVEFSRDGATWLSVSGGVPAVVRLNPGDSYRVTHSAAPAINLVTR
jgi:lysophospholipase L1-like esterase